jgi:hypothetical protein
MMSMLSAMQRIFQGTVIPGDWYEGDSSEAFCGDLTALFPSMDWLGIPTSHTFSTEQTYFEMIQWLLRCLEVDTGNNLLKTADLCLGRNRGTRNRNWGIAQDGSVITERDQASK